MFKWSLAVGVILANLITSALAGTVTLVTSRSELRGESFYLLGPAARADTDDLFHTCHCRLKWWNRGEIDHQCRYRIQRSAGSPWQGNFAPGDYLIGMGQLTPSAPIEIGFAHPVSGVGDNSDTTSSPRHHFHLSRRSIFTMAHNHSLPSRYLVSWITLLTIPRRSLEQQTPLKRLLLQNSSRLQ